MLSSQTFHVGDLGKILLLVGLEILLSADNAIILALLVKHLKPEEQKKALFYGLAGAFIFRGIAIIAVSLLVSLWWIQLAGALYLLWLPIKHFKDAGAGHKVVAKMAGFWATVLYVEFTDIAFAIDSVLVAVATEPAASKRWVVYVGAMAGVLALRWAAGSFLKVLEKYPNLEHMAYILVGWAGMKLLFLAGHTLEKFGDKSGGFKMPFHVPEMNPLVFWGGVGVIVLWGLVLSVRSVPVTLGPGAHDDPDEIWEDAVHPEPKETPKSEP